MDGQVADVVRSCSPRVQPNRLDPPQQLRAVLRLDKPHLKIRPGGNLYVAGREFLCHAREFAELICIQDAAWNSQPCHEAFFVWREIKESVPFEPENLLLVRSLVRSRVVQNQLVAVERMQLTLYALLKN